MDVIFGKPDVPDDQYEKAAAAEAARQARVDAGLAEINDVFSQYDQDFYDQTSDAYMDYMTPQLEDQYADGLRELQYALARQGRFNSSLEVSRKAQAAKDLEFQRQELIGKASQAAADSESAVTAAKEKMVKLNLANADPDLAASLSVGQAGLLNQPAKYDPLVDVFENITEGLASREEIQNRRKIRDQINLVNQGSGSGKIVG